MHDACTPYEVSLVHHERNSMPDPTRGFRNRDGQRDVLPSGDEEGRAQHEGAGDLRVDEPQTSSSRPPRKANPESGEQLKT